MDTGTVNDSTNLGHQTTSLQAHDERHTKHQERHSNSPAGIAPNSQRSTPMAAAGRKQPIASMATVGLKRASSLT
jgi:hypothetical protein